MSLLLDSYLISAAWQRWFSNFKISVELTSVRLKMSGPLQLKRQQQLLSGSSCGFRQKITRITSPSSFLWTYDVNVTNRLSIRNKVAYIIKLISFLRCWDCFFKDCPGQGGGQPPSSGLFFSFSSSTLDHSATAPPSVLALLRCLLAL